MPIPEALRRLGVEVPICQAPIGSLASAELAAAVAEAGALGHVACTWRTLDDLQALLRLVSTQTERAVGANFVLDFPIEERLAVALEHGVPAVSFFWGDGSRYLPRVRAAGAVTMQVVGSVGEARRAADAGFDLVVAQGREAGGHVRGEQGTMTLVPEVVDAVSPIPVLAGGGIADRRGVAAAFALGASGVWVGTRFAAAREANIHPTYQELLVAAAGADTVRSTLFDIGWPEAPMRTLRNSTVRAWEAAGRPSSPGRPNEGEPIGRRGDAALPRYHFAAPTREAAGDIEAMALYAGEGTGLVRAVEPAAAIVADLAAGVPANLSGRGATPAPGEHAGNAPAALDDRRAERWAVIYRPGPAWRAGRRVTEQDLGPHRAFVRALFEEGRVTLAGAFLDDSGGMAVLSARDRSEAERTLASDPAVVSGVMIGEVRPYLLLFPPNRTTP